uniref:Uncharacterized protein n=1 Tax=Sipha flava TaxID=143950 RepID=A0A2S2PZL5_9HEMI
MYYSFSRSFVGPRRFSCAASTLIGTCILSLSLLLLFPRHATRPIDRCCCCVCVIVTPSGSRKKTGGRAAEEDERIRSTWCFTVTGFTPGQDSPERSGDGWDRGER